MNYLVHYGTQGMHWGERRYQNMDGTLTPLGRLHYGRTASKYAHNLNKLDDKYVKVAGEFMEAEDKKTVATNRAEKFIKKVESKPSPTELDVARLRKMRKDIEKYGKKANLSAKQMKEIESTMWKSMGQYMSEGYVVNNKKVIKDSKKGEMFAAAVIGGTVGMSVYNLYKMPRTMKIHKEGTYTTEYNGQKITQSPRAIVGNKFKVEYIDENARKKMLKEINNGKKLYVHS